MNIGLQCLWTVKERLWLPISGCYTWNTVLQNKNLFTLHGLTSLASAPGGDYLPAKYLILENNRAVVPVNCPKGSTQILVDSRIDQSGDTKIVLAPGLASQENISFTGVEENGSYYTYTLATPTQYDHPVGSYVVRAVRQSDTLSSVINEFEYEPTAAPGLRVSSVAGYSAAAGQYTIQFYLTATMARGYISHIGLSETEQVGQGNLHNHVVLGFDHSSTTDLSIDGNISLVNL